MKFCFFTIAARNWGACILILILTLNTGCGITKPITLKILEIKPFEEMTEESYKKLQLAKELTLETEISSQVFISQRKPYYSVEYLKANLKILPMTDSRQKILSLEMIPQGKVVDHSIEFKLDAPSPGLHEFKLKAEAVYRYEYVQVPDKIPFPLQVTTAEQINYARPSLNIDSDNEEIQALASSIAKGEDDLYRVVFKASKWVIENVRHEVDISTISTSQKASWVLENRRGVCDEKTNLYIGLLRSLGIPAKFIIGFKGVNYNHALTFKPHAWAEVYFPSAGWVPFDVAYNQLGFIDATHIKLTESADTSDPITSYEWKSIDISDHNISDEGETGHDLVSIKDLRISTKIKQETGIITPLLEVTPYVWHNYIDMGSCNVIEATVTNPNNFYVITDLSLQIPSELKLMGENKKMLLLEPDTRITVYWIVKSTIDVGENMPTMIATFPINVVSSKSASTSVKFRASKGQGYNKYSFESLKNQVGKKFRKTL
jgi:hypothetical protein